MTCHALNSIIATWTGVGAWWARGGRVIARSAQQNPMYCSELRPYTIPASVLLPIKNMQQTGSLASSSSQSARDRSTRLFYEAVTLIGTVKPSSGFRSVPKTNWHRFLDHLCWLCDHRRGGQTVTAIAVQQTPAGSKFWLASNKRDKSTSSVHLSSVLEDLEQVCGASATEIAEIEDRICAQSVRLSRSRVHDYSRRLKRLVEAAAMCRNPTDEGLFHRSSLSDTAKTDSRKPS